MEVNVVKPFWRKSKKYGQRCGTVVEWSLSIPEVRGSNPVISKIYIKHNFIVNCIEKTIIKKKEALEWPFLRKPKNLDFPQS